MKDFCSGLAGTPCCLWRAVGTKQYENNNVNIIMCKLIGFLFYERINYNMDKFNQASLISVLLWNFRQQRDPHLWTHFNVGVVMFSFRSMWLCYGELKPRGPDSCGGGGGSPLSGVGYSGSVRPGPEGVTPPRPRYPPPTPSDLSASPCPAVAGAGPEVGVRQPENAHRGRGQHQHDLA